MELKVLKSFRDKDTKKVYEAGQVIKVSKQRGDEILKSPYGLAQEVSTKNNTKKDEQKQEEQKEV